MKKGENKSAIVITPPRAQTGFRLAGVEAWPAASEEELNSRLEKIVAGEKAGLLAIPESMRGWVSGKNRRALKKADLPVTLYYNYPEVWEKAPAVEEALSVMVRHTLGYRIKIRL